MATELVPVFTRDDLPENALTVSHSQISTALSCRQKWYWSYGLSGGYKLQANRSMKLGTAIHRWLAGHYEGQSFDELYAPVAEMTFEDQSYELKAAALWNKYREWAALHDNFVPIEVEKEAFIPHFTPGGKLVWIHVIIDLLGQYSNGDLVVNDHKSTGSMRSWNQFMARFDSQTSLYAWAATQLGYKVRHQAITVINTYPYKDVIAQSSDKLFARYTVKTNEAILHARIEEVGRLIDELYSEQFFPAKKFDKDCSSCGYSQLCELDIQGLPYKHLLVEYNQPKETPLTVRIELKKGEGWDYQV